MCLSVCLCLCLPANHTLPGRLYGGYEALRGGNINESMVDLTGGVVELIDLRSPPPNLFARLIKASRRGSLIGCAIEVCKA